MTTHVRPILPDQAIALERQEISGDFSSLTFQPHNIMDGVPLPCFMLDGDGLYLAGNSSFYRFYGTPEGFNLGRDPYLLLAPEKSQHFRLLDGELYLRGGGEAHETEIVTVDGRVCPVLLKKTVIVNERGDKCGILVAIVERTELTTVKNALYSSEAEKRAILDGSPGIVCLFDVEEKVIWANSMMCEFHEDPVGKTCHEVFCRREKACNSCAVPLSLNSGTVQSTIRQFEIFTSKGEERIYELTGTPVKDEHGKVVSVVVIGRDVTDTNMLEKQLRHTQKMEAIGTLAGGIAHDFNNVLTPIMGYSEIIRLKMMQSSDRDETLLEFIEGILRAAKRAKKLVEQILTFSRSSEQKASLQYIHPIVKEVMKLMRVTLPSTITINEKIDERCGTVSVDPVQIHQILINLCTNSAHAMAGGHGALTVTLSAEKEYDEVMGTSRDWVKLSVTDTGCGIPSDMLERIFEPYFTTKEKSQGTGMGLAMVHGIINRQGGRVEVQSDVGVGTTFDIYLPVAQNATRIDQVISTIDLLHGKGRILLIDDEAQVVQVTGELLSSLGYEVTARTSARAALSLFADNPDGFDMVLTDLTMPELTGVELSTQIKAIRADLPVVLFSGYSDQLSEEEAQAAGIDRHCMKPVSLRELSGIIYNTLHPEK